MRSREDIQAYIDRFGLSYKEVGDGMWIVRDASTDENIVVRLQDPLVLFRMKVMELDNISSREKLFEALLTLNAEEMNHGAYGVADGAVVITCSLRLENLDYDEFQATIDDFTLAITNHYERLAAFRTAA
jgi:hypothetical protein